MVSGHGAGWGKLILFGEHFVVYRVPALVAAIEGETTCTVNVDESQINNGNDHFSVDDQRPAVPGYKVDKKDEQDESIRIILKHLHCEQRNVAIRFGGDLVCMSGIGASAASCVALSRALNMALDMKMSEEQINASAYEGEKGYHGTPSGIDNTASTYGGILRFLRTDGAPEFSKLKMASSCYLVYAATHITASTTKVVGDVRALKESKPEWFDGLLHDYKRLYDKAVHAIETGDWKTVGTLMNENHAMLQQITVSCKELDDLVNAARAHGALGAKMTGTGRGGLMIALVSDREVGEKIRVELEKVGAAGTYIAQIQM